MVIAATSVFLLSLAITWRLRAAARVRPEGQGQPKHRQLLPDEFHDDDLRQLSPHMEPPSPAGEASAEKAFHSPAVRASSMIEANGTLDYHFVFHGGCDFHHFERALETARSTNIVFDGWCAGGMVCGVVDAQGKSWDQCAAACIKRGFCKAISFRFNLKNPERSWCAVCTANALQAIRKESDWGIWIKEPLPEAKLPGNGAVKGVEDRSDEDGKQAKIPPPKKMPEKKLLTPVQDDEVPPGAGAKIPPPKKMPEKKPLTPVQDDEAPPGAGTAGEDQEHDDYNRDPPPRKVVVNKEQFCEAKWHCSSEQRWRLGDEMIKSGSYGQVWPALTNKDDEPTSAQFAIKYPVSFGPAAPTWKPKECKDIRNEAKRMLEIENDLKGACKNAVMRIKDPHPCWIGFEDDPNIDDYDFEDEEDYEEYVKAWRTSANFKPVPGAYVMERMNGDLASWIKRKAAEKRQKEIQGDEAWIKEFEGSCLPDIAKKVMQIIQCFHEGKWVHADIKLPNILYKTEDERKCPSEVRLADFGLSRPKGTSWPMHSSKNFDSCWYLPSDMFVIQTADRTRDNITNDENYYSLGLADPDKREVLHEVGLDWCAWHFGWSATLEKAGFKVSESLISNPHWSGNCGYMGIGRSHPFKVLEP